MHEVEMMLTGKMKMHVFIDLFTSDSNLQNDIANLIPQDAVHNRAHTLWKCISYDSLANNNFDFYKFLQRMNRFDDSIGDNLNLFGSIRQVYCHTHSDLICTTEYEDAYGLYLDVVKDCFDGPEIRHIVEKIVKDALKLKSKRSRIQQAKESIKVLLHISGKNIPHWIHGPEWPMGEKSPMIFVSQKQIGESVQYSFLDADTKEVRIVEQYY